MRKSPMPRRETPIARSPINRRRRKKDATEWARVYGSPERTAWISSQTCVGCGVGGDGEFRCENAHVATGQDAGGTSRKADARFIVSLCHECHIEDLHVNGRETFEREHNVNLLAEAARIDREYCAYAAALGMAS